MLAQTHHGSLIASFLGGAALLVGLPSAAADAWVGRPPSAEEQARCKPVPMPLVLSVAPAYRGAAMKKLEAAQVAALSDDEARALLGRPASESRSLANELLDDAIGRLKEQRTDELDHQQGSWSATDEQTLRQLSAARNAPESAELRPYLARALVGFEGTGRFQASDCGDVVDILHGSLGWSPPHPSRRPVIVFLSHRPISTHAVIAVAR
jgi:hypothetical protein